MTIQRLIGRLRFMIRNHSVAADRAETQSMAEYILQHRRWLVLARRTIERLDGENRELRDRLVRQACYFEHIEAATEPKTWPLLRDDRDPGAAL